MFIKKLHQQVICNHHEPIAHTPLGQLRGVKTEDAYIFRGIRYAHARRFRMPEPEAAWEGVKDAIIYGFVCPEIITPVPHDQFTVPHVFYPQHEDCQYLNIWTQSLDVHAKRPVMVWLHGGGYATGSGIEHYAYDGEELSKAQNVVVVSFNHRLNVLGYLDLSAYGEEYALSGNVGMADIVGRGSRQCDGVRPVRGRRQGDHAFADALSRRSVSPGGHSERRHGSGPGGARAGKEQTADGNPAGRAGA